MCFLIGDVIQTFRIPSTYSQPPTHKNYWNACKCIVVNIIQFFSQEKPSLTSPTAKPSPSKPTWHRLPNLEKKSNLAPHKRSPASSRSPLGTKTSQMGVSYPATPEI